jgi:hypothetical protein
MALTVSFDVDGCEGSFGYEVADGRRVGGLVLGTLGAVGILVWVYGLFAVFLPLIVVGFVVWQLGTWLYKLMPDWIDWFVRHETATFRVRGSQLLLDRPSGHDVVELVGARIGRGRRTIEIHRALGPPVVLVGADNQDATLDRLAEALRQIASRDGTRRSEVPAALDGLVEDR